MARDLLLEIGAEEIPASFIGPALEDLRRALTERMAEARLKHGEVSVYGTPRRLAVLVRDVADSGEDVVKEVLGPSAKAAFDAEGKPTKAAEKFAESLKLSVDKLGRSQTAKGEYLSARVEEKGRPAADTLKDALHVAVHSINFRKSMRWGDVEASFARPVQWLVALLGGDVIPVVFGDVKSGRTTHGHRFLAPGAIELKAPADYEAALAKAHVVADIAKRRAQLVEKLAAAAKAAGGKLLEDEGLVDQVTNLVELPSPVVGTFEERHLDLPPEVLVQEMKSHQRYFSLVDGAGKLLPKFIAVSNTPVRDEQLSLRGYQRVLRARLADGRFFYDEDRKTPLMDRVEKLGRVVWQGQLGTYLEKVERFRTLGVWLAVQTKRAGESATIERAATLAKADLVTGMVGEFPELQGVMGREYARASGEPEAVAQAIFEHYLPRGAEDALPTQDAGALIGIADRLDSLCGIFAIGKAPSGAADPFGLRRACIAIIRLVLGRGYRFSLAGSVDEALRLLAPKLTNVKRKAGDAAPREQVLEFFRGRLKSLWGEQHRTDVVEAVLAAGFDDLVAAHKRLEALSLIVGRADFQPLAVAFKRVVNIVEKQGRDVAGGQTQSQKLVDDAERQLHSAFTQARNSVAGFVQSDDFSGALKEITGLKPAVDTFFDKVMVMAEDKELRENRIRLLTEIGALFNQVADFSKIQAEAAA
ncbi:glycine--tRNA ligase subunit beta [Myxococcus llanfairpwllgwyngyllgogerychwyrndrobwllllantysiliogogogochensis]|uniref:Glycine--tRNA ligase beta subunit n=1 Tax=Myxococcus llanfairpwllgwyngyllgogerychwyrndrobwllllantysiliogogogochensis TaxID=2590453 RepID=A0A540WJK6_9BACT|nr:glycine--tRNA ligase subunit beta [Myxococcus llanfairpwllgwyngyllgogerychwyrndrobwllllantysiliogogogochensis]TQF09209.1 glycine--tRNA ligase subunit beta [Myxococcus llanfairpwllgwyngyllgogerychwyrndrobwllllantysiliogogogochensis]